MTYSTGNPIQAADYNTFATATAGMNAVFGDVYPGATTLPTAAFGYGQTPALSSVSVGGPILASQWGALFQSIKKSGIHQGTTISPPVPSVDPVIGAPIVAFNTPSTMASAIALITSRKHNIAVGQSTLTSGTSYAQPLAARPWTNALTWNFQVDFGSWNNARYFFNSGGTLNLSGSYSPATTSEETQWAQLLSSVSPLVFNYNSTKPSAGVDSALGFYNLTPTFQTIFQKTVGGGGGYYYANSYIQIQAKLAATAGTSGIVVFSVKLANLDSTPNAKTGTTTFRLDHVQASGSSVSYPGIVAVSPIGTNSGFVAT